MLTRGPCARERGRVQGMNDFVVFGGVFLASLSSGGLMNCFGRVHRRGLNAVNLAMLPFLALAGGALIWLVMRPAPLRSDQRLLFRRRGLRRFGLLGAASGAHGHAASPANCSSIRGVRAATSGVVITRPPGRADHEAAPQRLFVPQGQPHPVQPNQRILPLTRMRAIAATSRGPDRPDARPAALSHRRVSASTRTSELSRRWRSCARRSRGRSSRRTRAPSSRISARSIPARLPWVNWRSIAAGMGREASCCRRARASCRSAGSSRPPSVQPLPRAFGQRSRTTQGAGQIAQALTRGVGSPALARRASARPSRPGARPRRGPGPAISAAAVASARAGPRRSRSASCPSHVPRPRSGGWRVRRRPHHRFLVEAPQILHDPPPRATMNRSGRGSARPRQRVEARIAAVTCGAQPSPCTATGQMITRVGKRSRNRCRMSRITAPDGESPPL